jgi:outer membrane immunogenic protein
MRSLWTFSTALLCAVSAFAMHKKKEEPPPPDPCDMPQCVDLCDCGRWSGFTFGINAGGLINAAEGRVKPTGDFELPANVADNPQRTDDFNMGGGAFVTGAQVGYNHQFKVMVLGVETDFNYSTLSKRHHHTRTLVAPLLGDFNVRVSELFNWFGTFRGRFGYTFKYPVLIYGTGGLAYGHVKSKTHVDFTSALDQYEGSSSCWRIGWTLGGGVEWGFTRHWSLKTEYLYLQLRDVHYFDPNRPPPAFPTFFYHTKLEPASHVIRLGVNYTI